MKDTDTGPGRFYEIISELERKGNWWYRARRDFLDGYLKKLNRHFDRALDAGCGPGAYCRILRKYASEVHGLDKSPTALAIASGKPYDRLHEAAIEESCIDEKYDLIICMEVLEHIEKDTEALSKLAGMLQDGGIIISAVPAHMFLWHSNDVFSGHVRRYDKETYRKLLTSAGLNIRELGYWNHMLFLPTLVYTKLFDRPGKENNLLMIPPAFNSLLFFILHTENLMFSSLRKLMGISIISMTVK
jgi:SAM-dependent methyltransferase